MMKVKSAEPASRAMACARLLMLLSSNPHALVKLVGDIDLVFLSVSACISPTV